MKGGGGEKNEQNGGRNDGESKEEGPCFCGIEGLWGTSFGCLPPLVVEVEEAEEAEAEAAAGRAG